MGSWKRIQFKYSHFILTALQRCTKYNDLGYMCSLISAGIWFFFFFFWSNWKHWLIFYFSFQKNLSEAIDILPHYIWVLLLVKTEKEAIKNHILPFLVPKKVLPSSTSLHLVSSGMQSNGSVLCIQHLLGDTPASLGGGEQRSRVWKK